MPRYRHALHYIVLWVAGSIGFASNVSADITNYAVFGKNGVALTGKDVVEAGLVGSNGPVAIGTFSQLSAGIGGGGDFNTSASAPGSMSIGGPITFNGNVYLGSFNNLYGPINAGADASFGSSLKTNFDINAGGSFNASFSTINANVHAGVDAKLTTSFDTVTGNVSGNHNVEVQGVVNGNVTYGNTLTTGAFTHLNGLVVHGTTPVSPIPYLPQTVPAADAFTSGGATITDGGSAAAPLAPGSYGGLGFSSFADLYLGPGNYYFSSLAFNGLTSLHLVNLTGSNSIHIYSTGDISGSLFFPTVNGQSFTAADPALASNVLLETLGNYSLDSDMYGTIFAPNGSITLGNFRTICGSLIAGDTISAGSLTVGYVAPFEAAYVVPEPAALPLAALMVGALACRRERSLSRR